MKSNTTRGKQLNRVVLEKVGRMFGVLSEPSRLEILQLLEQGELSVNEITEHLQAKQPSISKQLAVLLEAGLVSRERHGSQMIYRISEPMVFRLCELVCGKFQRDAETELKVFRGTAA